MSSYRVTPWVLIIGGFFGLLAAFELTLEKIAVTADPNYIPECDINPVLSCGSIPPIRHRLSASPTPSLD